MIYLCINKQIFIIIMSKILKYRIKEFMDRASLSVYDVADYCRKDRQTVYNWCNLEVGAKQKIPPITMKTIAEFFGCKPSDLITDTSDLAGHVSIQNAHQADIYKAVIR